jgi:two-component system phosphate regulon sensor histidine kinase PhoR
MAGGLGAADALRMKDSMYAEISRIDSLLKDHPQERATWEEIKHTALEFNEVYNRTMKEYDLGHKELAALEWKSGQSMMRRFYAHVQRLSDLQNGESNRQANVIQTYSDYLQTILKVALFVSVLLAFSLAWLISTTTTSRFKIVLANARRLTQGLRPALDLQGQDELALLNRTYQDLYSALKRLREKDRAVIENVADLVFVLDAALWFKEVNKVCCQTFERTKEELLQLRLADVLEAKGNIADTLRNLQHQPSAVVSLEVSYQGSAGRSHLRLRSSWVESEQSHFCVAQDITELKRIEEMRQDLIATVSHDLRSPLSAVQIILDRLMRRNFDSETDGALQAVRANTGKLLSLVNNLLDIERQENCPEDLVLSEHQLAPIVDEAMKALSPLAAEKRQNIVNALTEDVVALIDRERLYHVVFNLIDNAVKYSPPLSRIEISGTAKGKYFLIAVKDQGPVIQAEMYHRVFERFGRLYSTTEQPVGTGLGLFICKGIIERHGGEIGVGPNQECGTNCGNVFWFTVHRCK